MLKVKFELLAYGSYDYASGAKTLTVASYSMYPNDSRIESAITKFKKENDRFNMYYFFVRKVYDVE